MNTKRLIILIGILLNMAAFANAIGNAVTPNKDGTYTETINGWQLGPINRRNVTQSDALTGFKDGKNKLDSNMKLKSGTAHSPIPGGNINLNENPPELFDDLNGYKSIRAPYLKDTQNFGTKVMPPSTQIIRRNPDGTIRDKRYQKI